MKKTVLSATVAVATVASLAVSGCSLSSDNQSAGGNAAKEIVLVTHDSWNPPKGSIEAFEKSSGYTVTIKKSGDTGAMANKLILTKNSPIGDAVYGVDNTFSSKVVQAEVLQPYSSPKQPETAKKFALPGKGAEVFNPIDYGNVCVNVDDSWFAAKGKTAPRTLDDLVQPEYRGMTVVESAADSSPGLAFLLATISKYGQDGWKNYWQKLLSNDTKVAKGWTDAWEIDYTAGGGKGTRPVVVSYDTSPAATKVKTSAMLNTCFRQVEYAGVLQGAKNPQGAKALIDYLYSDDFQKGLPDSMYVLPVNTALPLPDYYAGKVKIAENPLSVDPDLIATQRENWLREWMNLISK